MVKKRANFTLACDFNQFFSFLKRTTHINSLVTCLPTSGFTILEMSYIKRFIETFLTDTDNSVTQLISSQCRCLASCFTSMERLIVHQIMARYVFGTKARTNHEAICNDPDSFPLNSLAFGATFGVICILIMWKQKQDFWLWQTILDLLSEIPEQQLRTCLACSHASLTTINMLLRILLDSHRSLVLKKKKKHESQVLSPSTINRWDHRLYANKCAKKQDGLTINFGGFFYSYALSNEQPLSAASLQ